MPRGQAGVAVSADVIAWAVVASARVFGDDPIEALSGGVRRCLPPAVVGLARSTGAQQATLARMVGLSTGTVSAAKANQKGRFREALAAAIEAVELVLEDDRAAKGAVEPEPEVAPAVLHPRAPEPAPSPAPVLMVSASPTQVTPATPFKPMPVIYRGDPTPSAPLGARILAALAKAPGTPRGLATVLDAKEELVGREITRLAHEGAIVAGDMPASGRRDQRWKLVKP